MDFWKAMVKNTKYAPNTLAAGSLKVFAFIKTHLYIFQTFWSVFQNF